MSARAGLLLLAGAWVLAQVFRGGLVEWLAGGAHPAGAAANASTASGRPAGAAGQSAPAGLSALELQRWYERNGMAG